ncbi:hypothetical protein L2E82_40698 [Cichorium intybus]|uniref:Uncharacterized protein n=1 Tax=Cichorium intybus TaxID=13427 RepID=A0ACB9AL06_CICIN|nr:hypothetical protein L2E82_40698 [Cichorium intybus]
MCGRGERRSEKGRLFGSNFATATMAARASFSEDSRIVKVPLSKSLLLKDYLIDDLSSCSSNGFRSYPRRQCCTKVRYLIEIDLNKHINLPPKKKKFLKIKSKLKPKSKSSLMLQKASAAVVNVFNQFRSTSSGKSTKANFLPKNLSRKLSKHGFWKRKTDRHNKEFKRLDSFEETVIEKKNALPPLSKVSTAVTTTAAEVNTSSSNSNSSASSDSYFTATSGSSTTGSYSKMNVAQDDVVDSKQHAAEKNNTANRMKAGATTAIATATATGDPSTNGNAKKGPESEKKEQSSPVSVMEFPCDSDNDDEDEVTSPFKHIPKVQRIKSLAKLTRVRLEDRITLSESRTCELLLHEESSNQLEKKASALLQQLKATMSSRSQFESTMTQNYDDQVEKRDIGLELEYQVFTSLVEEMLLEFYL